MFVGITVYGGKVVPIVDDGADADGVGPVLRKLYNRIRRIQVGEEEDKFNWMYDV